MFAVSARDQTNLFGDPALQIKDPLVDPEQPAKPSGPLTGKINEEQTYTVSTTDPNGDHVFYFWEWGDGTDSGWMGPYSSGDTCEAMHTWIEKGSYQEANDLFQQAEKEYNELKRLYPSDLIPEHREWWSNNIDSPKDELREFSRAIENIENKMQSLIKEHKE